MKEHRVRLGANARREARPLPLVPSEPTSLPTSRTRVAHVLTVRKLLFIFSYFYLFDLMIFNEYAHIRAVDTTEK